MDLQSYMKRELLVIDNKCDKLHPGLHLDLTTTIPAQDPLALQAPIFPKVTIQLDWVRVNDICPNPSTMTEELGSSVSFVMNHTLRDIGALEGEH